MRLFGVFLTIVVYILGVVYAQDDTVTRTRTTRITRTRTIVRPTTRTITTPRTVTTTATATRTSARVVTRTLFRTLFRTRTAVRTVTSTQVSTSTVTQAGAGQTQTVSVTVPTTVTQSTTVTASGASGGNTTITVTTAAGGSTISANASTVTVTANGTTVTTCINPTDTPLAVGFDAWPLVSTLAQTGWTPAVVTTKTGNTNDGPSGPDTNQPLNAGTHFLELTSTAAQSTYTIPFNIKIAGPTNTTYSLTYRYAGNTAAITAATPCTITPRFDGGSASTSNRACALGGASPGAWAQCTYGFTSTAAAALTGALTIYCPSTASSVYLDTIQVIGNGPTTTRLAEF